MGGGGVTAEKAWEEDGLWVEEDLSQLTFAWLGRKSPRWVIEPGI